MRPHPFFERRGDDIHIDLPITVGEAIRGAEVERRRSTDRCACASRPARRADARCACRGKGVKKKSGAGDQYSRIVSHRAAGAPRPRAVEAIEAAYPENPRANLRTTL